LASILIAVLIIVLLLFPFLIYTVFWYEVGNSLGGLLARAYAGKDESKGIKVKGVITWGSPHQGSELVLLLPESLKAPPPACACPHADR